MAVILTFLFFITLAAVFVVVGVLYLLWRGLLRPVCLHLVKTGVLPPLVGSATRCQHSATESWRHFIEAGILSVLLAGVEFKIAQMATPGMWLVSKLCYNPLGSPCDLRVIILLPTVLDAAMIFLALWGAYSAWQLAPSHSTLSSTAAYKIITGIAEISVFAVAAIVLYSYEVKDLPARRRDAEWRQAYKQHVADTPSLENLAEVQLLAPEQVLILSRFGDYVPGPTHAGKTEPATIVNPLVAKVPSASYGVRYGLPGAPTSGANIGPHVDVQVREYPNAAWAKWEITEQGFDVGLGNPARPVKFGNLLFGQAKPALKGQDGWYIWESEDWLILVQFFSADPDEILKAYLERFPASPVDRF